MKLLILFSIVVLLFWIAPASAAEWQSVYSITVHNGQTITYQGLTTNIKLPSPVTAHKDKDGNLVLDYPVINPQVLLNINGSLIFLGEGQIYQDDDNCIRITASGFTDPNSLAWEFSQYAPSATLKIEYWKQDNELNLQLRLLPQYTTIEYGKQDVISIGIEIKNIGKVVINDIDLTYDLGNLTYAKNEIEISSIAVDEIKIYNVTAIVPNQYGEHKVTANASFKYQFINPNPKNNYDKYYSFPVAATITITPPKNNIVITKVITERLYTCFNYMVVITVANSGMFDMKNVKITDSVPMEFTSKNLSYLWELPILKAGMQETFIYNIAPISSGNLIITPAHISYTIDKEYSLDSNIVNVNVVDTGKSCIRTIITPKPTTPLKQPPTQQEIITPTQTSEVQRVVNTPIPVVIRKLPINTPIPETPGFFGLEMIFIIFLALRVRKPKI